MCPRFSNAYPSQNREAKEILIGGQNGIVPVKLSQVFLRTTTVCQAANEMIETMH